MNKFMTGTLLAAMAYTGLTQVAVAEYVNNNAIGPMSGWHINDYNVASARSAEGYRGAMGLLSLHATGEIEFHNFTKKCSYDEVVDGVISINGTFVKAVTVCSGNVPVTWAKTQAGYDFLSNALFTADTINVGKFVFNVKDAKKVYLEILKSKGTAI